MQAWIGLPQQLHPTAIHAHREEDQVLACTIQISQSLAMHAEHQFNRCQARWVFRRRLHAPKR